MAVTKFDILLERFYKRIEKDEKFFDYYGISVERAVEIAQQRATQYLIEVLDRLSGVPNIPVDFSDYNEDAREINFALKPKENKLIVNLMFETYMSRDKALLHAFELSFTPNDLNVFSPANERNSYMNFMNDLEEENEIALDDYCNRDRNTNAFVNMIDYAKYRGW